jgi:hypothetical protein
LLRNCDENTIFLPEVDIEILDHELEEDYLSHVSKKKMKNSLKEKEKEIEKQMIDHEVEKRTISMKKLLKKETPSAILEKMKNDEQAFMEGMNGDAGDGDGGGGDDDEITMMMMMMMTMTMMKKKKVEE